MKKHKATANQYYPIFGNMATKSIKKKKNIEKGL